MKRFYREHVQRSAVIKSLLTAQCRVSGTSRFAADV